MADIAVLLPDGSRREVPHGSSLRDVAAGIGSRLAKAALAGVVNGAEREKQEKTKGERISSG